MIDAETRRDRGLRMARFSREIRQVSRAAQARLQAQDWNSVKVVSVPRLLFCETCGSKYIEEEQEAEIPLCPACQHDRELEEGACE